MGSPESPKREPDGPRGTGERHPGRLPNPLRDYRAERCGHNFAPMECPYEFCGYRDTLTALQGLVDALAKRAQSEVVAVASTETLKSETIHALNEKWINDHYARRAAAQMLDLPVPTPEAIAAGLGVPVSVVAKDVGDVTFNAPEAPTFPLSEFKRTWPDTQERRAKDA